LPALPPRAEVGMSRTPSGVAAKTSGPAPAVAIAPDPWLSVVVPWWNRLEYVRETLDSMASQTDQGFECLIVDQGHDDTLHLVEEYAGRFDFRILYAPEFPDWMSKTNAGFRAARGRYVCMLHTDDVWRSDRVAKLRAAHDRHPGAGLLMHAVRFIDPSSRALGEWRAPLRADRLLESADLVEHLIIQNFISCPAPVLRRDLIGSGIDPTLWYTGDWELYLRVAFATRSVYLDAPLADFRLHATSLTMQKSRSSADFRRQLDQVLERFEAALPPARRKRLLRVARFSNAVNAALAEGYHGRLASLLQLLPHAARLGPSDWKRYFNDSRIVERTAARLRLLGARGSNPAALSATEPYPSFEA
jgi:glycosyltransferase involved in cell wall biosynthesis